MFEPPYFRCFYELFISSLSRIRPEGYQPAIPLGVFPGQHLRRQRELMVTWATKHGLHVVKTMPFARTITPVITIFIAGMFTIPSHGWFMILYYPH
jgi:hypothetical protein